jgi:uncharacterized membrane protein
MILMALDHVRDFIHRGAMSGSPTDLASTTPVLFMTRWITHVCAPVFLFTAGLSAFLWWKNGGHTRKELSWFLVSRGLWLVVLEVTVMRLACNFNYTPEYPVFLLVLWGLGIAMIGMAGLVWLPVPWLGGLASAVIVLHNTLDGVRAAQLGWAAPLWTMVHEVGAMRLFGQSFIVAYPLVPWMAVMALGFCCGPLFLRPAPARARPLAGAGALMIAGFVALRAINGYGDGVAWSVQPSAAYTVLSFLNTSKYPPSLAFILMTLGPAFLALAWLDRRPPPATHPVVVLGRVPLFFFVVHFYAAHAAAIALAFFTHGSATLAFMFHPLPSMGGPAGWFPAGFGYSLPVTYVVWVVIVAGLYPACRWFANVKARRRAWWTSYL